MVPSGKIPSPDASVEKHIPPNDNRLRRKVKAEAARAVTGHMRDLASRSKEFLLTFPDDGTSRDRLDFKSETPIAEKITIGDHWQRQLMVSHAAAVPLHNGSGISDVIEMAMGQQKKINLFPGKSLVGTLRSIKEDSSLRGLIEETVRIKGSAGKGFEPILRFVVRHKTQRKLIQICPMTILKSPNAPSDRNSCFPFLRKRGV